MEFAHIKNHSLNLGLFDKKTNEAKPSQTSTPTDKEISKGHYYTHQSLCELKDHCQGILDLGDSATKEEVLSLKKALDEASQLEKGDLVIDGEVETVYFKKMN